METEDLGLHISRRFNEDLEQVRNSVLNMGELVEEQLDRALTASDVRHTTLADVDAEVARASERQELES